MFIKERLITVVGGRIFAACDQPFEAKVENKSQNKAAQPAVQTKSMQNAPPLTVQQGRIQVVHGSLMLCSVEINGLCATKQWVVAQYFDPVLSAQNLPELLARLHTSISGLKALNIFRDIDVELDTTRSGLVQVNVSVEEMPRFLLKTGTEIGADEGSVVRFAHEAVISDCRRIFPQMFGMRSVLLKRWSFNCLVEPRHVRRFKLDFYSWPIT
jgi:hypothetical protein